MLTELCTFRQRYQDFLQKLLSKPTLRNSELLHAFLTVQNIKPLFTNFSTPDIGGIYQSMAHKLRKEKGQNLDKFMSTFLASTCLQHEQPDVGVELSGDHNFHDAQKRGLSWLNEGPFKNNLNLSWKVKNFPCVVNKMEHTKGVCFCIAEASEFDFYEYLIFLIRKVLLIMKICLSLNSGQFIRGITDDISCVLGDSVDVPYKRGSVCK